MMRERPILFSAPMVRAILAGTKTQTRRAWREQPPPGVRVVADVGGVTACPHGGPGDRLWVREAWRVARKYDAVKPSELQQRAMTVEYEAGGYACNSPWNGGQWSASDDTTPRERPEWVGRYRPAMFMPRWASRITLEITGVRVERLQNISKGDAIAEGAPPSHPSIDRVSRELGHPDFPRSWYAQTWESINGAGSWDANPWVWAITFRRLAP